LNNKTFRRYFAPASVIILVLVAGFAFLNLQGTYSGPPSILDPDFKLWTGAGNASQLVVWNLETTNLEKTQYTTTPADFQGRDGLRLALLQSGIGSHLAYIRLSETLDGPSLATLMNSTLSLWVLKESCNCDSAPFGKSSVLVVVETNDGVHTLSFVFTDQRQGTLTILSHRIVFIPTASHQWVSEVLNIGREYLNANWGAPGTLTFSLIFGVGGGNIGWHVTYLANITTQRSFTQLGLAAEGVAFLLRLKRITEYLKF
jgi:hypothetical protein